MKTNQVTIIFVFLHLVEHILALNCQVGTLLVIHFSDGSFPHTSTTLLASSALLRLIYGYSMFLIGARAATSRFPKWSVIFPL